MKHTRRVGSSRTCNRGACRVREISRGCVLNLHDNAESTRADRIERRRRDLRQGRKEKREKERDRALRRRRFEKDPERKRCVYV